MLPRLQTELAARSGVTISKSQLSKALKRGGPLAAPAPARPEGCRGRRLVWVEAASAEPAGRSGRHLLLFGDESEVLTHPYLENAWARRGTDLRVPAPGQTCKRALVGVLDHGPAN